MGDSRETGPQHWCLTREDLQEALAHVPVREFAKVPHTQLAGPLLGALDDLAGQPCDPRHERHRGHVFPVRVSARASLAKIADLLPGPCPEPGLALGNDMCPCESGVVWPCDITRAAWLAAGLDPAAEMRKVLDAARREAAIEHAEWEALNEEDPEAARRQALRDLGWLRHGYPPMPARTASSHPGREYSMGAASAGNARMWGIGRHGAWRGIPIPRRPDTRHLRRHTLRVIADRLGYGAPWALRAVERGSGSVVLRLNSSGNCCAVESWLNLRGYQAAAAGRQPGRLRCGGQCPAPRQVTKARHGRRATPAR